MNYAYLPHPDVMAKNTNATWKEAFMLAGKDAINKGCGFVRVDCDGTLHHIPEHLVNDDVK